MPSFIARCKYDPVVLMRIGSPVQCEFVSMTSVGLAWSAALARMATLTVEVDRHREVVLFVAGKLRKGLGQETMSSLENWQRAVGGRSDRGRAATRWGTGLC